MTTCGKVARAAPGAKAARALQEEVGAASSIHVPQWANLRRRLNASSIRLSASRMAPAIIFNSASVAVFGSCTVAGDDTTASGRFKAAR